MAICQEKKWFLAIKITDKYYMETNGSDIVERIDMILVKRNLKRKALAEAIGFNVANIAHWKNRGNIPAADTALKIAHYLEVSVEWLITGENSDELSEDDRNLLSKWHKIDEGTKRSVNLLLDASISVANKQDDGNERISV